MTQPIGAGLSPAEAPPLAPTDWRRLSPRMLLVHPVREVGRALPALVALLLAGSSSGHGALWGLLGAAIVSALSLSRWLTTRFRVRADQVQIQEGLLRRRTVSARLDRVRTVDVTSSALHRVLGLARVEIGTGVSDRKGKSVLRLDGLSADQAARMRGELLHRSAALETGTTTGPDVRPPTSSSGPPTSSSGTPSAASRTTADVDPWTNAPAGRTLSAPVPSLPSAGVADEVEIARLRPEWVRFAPFTLSGVFTGLAIAGFGWRVVSEGQVDVQHVGPVHSVARQLDNLPLWLAVLEVVVAAIVFVALASTAGYLLSYWNFRLSRHRGGSFQVSRGLLTTRATSIEVSRLRGVAVSESLLVRLVGGARLVAIATGLDVRRGSSGNRGSTVLLPDAPLSAARRVAGEVLGRGDVAAAPLVAHGTSARRRRFSRAVGAAVALVVAVGVAWWVSGLHGPAWLFALVVVPLAVPLAADRAGNLGHVVLHGVLVSQSGSLIRRRAMLQTDSIIGWNVRQSYFQRRSVVATMVATTAAGRQSYRLLDLTLDEARRVADDSTPGLLAPFDAS